MTGPTDWRMDGLGDPDASEIRTGAGSLQLGRRNPPLVVFYNLGPVRMMNWDGGGRKTGGRDESGLRHIIRPVYQLDVWKQRVAL